MKPSWICTLAIQLSLCFVLYIALNLGRPQNSIYQHTGANGRRSPLDIYFISVTGGFRPLKEQTHLLKLMENVAKAYKAKFVVNISKLGKDDPLKQNASRLFPSLNVPWYTTRASKGQGVGCFQEQIKLPPGKTLDIISVDTGLLQDTMLMGSSSGNENTQLNWLTRTLEESNSNWRIVVGFQPLVVCEQNKERMEARQDNGLLHDIFMKFGVNVYLSRQGCTNYARQDSVTYIGNPGLIEEESNVASVNRGSDFKKGLASGFLLHRVSALEIVTYFVTSAGEVMYKTIVQQRGKEVM